MNSIFLSSEFDEYFVCLVDCSTWLDKTRKPTFYRPVECRVIRLLVK